MIIIEVFERGATPRYRPTAPTIVNQGRHLMTASQSRKSDRRARCLSTGHGRARSDIQPSSQIVRQFTAFDATRRSSMQPLHRRPTCWSASTPITHLIRGTQIPIAHAAPPTYPLPRFPPLEVCVRRPRCAPRHRHGAGIRKPSQKRSSGLPSLFINSILIGRRFGLAQNFT